MLRFACFFWCLLLTTYCSWAQAPTALPLRCLPVPSPGAYAPLRQALAGVQVVMLGEQTHQDGATFEAKIKLVRYLHDSLGFNTLAFEGDMYALDKARREMAAGRPVRPVLLRSVYEGIWSGTADFDTLAAYLDTHRRLQLAGIDCQLSGEYTQEELLPELRRFVTQDTRRRWTAADFYPGQELVAELSKGGGGPLRHPADTVRLARWLAQCQASVAYVAARQPAQASRARFWQQWLRSSGAYWRGELRAAQGHPEPVQNLRDRLLADNLVHLSRQPEHAKIIVWAASYHLANHISRIDLDDTLTAKHLRREALADAEQEPPMTARHLLGGAVPMGELVKRQLGAKVYALGFVAGGGTYGRLEEPKSLRPVPEPLTGSLEQAFRQQGCATGFVDLRHAPIGTTFYASPLGYVPLRAPWAEVFDGFYYTQVMRPTSSMAPVAVAAPAATGRKLLGQVRDAKTGEAIPFASVGLSGTSLGTVSNADGSFALFVPAGQRADSVRVSCLGYASVSVPARGTAVLAVRLTPQPHLLAAVLVTAPPRPEVIVQRARERISTNYPQQANSMQLYTRSRTWQNDSLRSTHEAALDFYDQEGYRRGSWEHAEKQRFLQLREQRQTGQPIQELPDFWLLWSQDPVLTERNPLEPGPARQYRLTLVGQTEYDGHPVYEVGFVCERPSAYTTPYAYPAPDSYQGTLYITTDTYAVVKYEAFTVRTPYAINKAKDLRRLGLTSPTSRQRTHHDVYQYEQVGGTYYLRYARHDRDQVYADPATGARQQTRRDCLELLATSFTQDKPVVLHTTGLRVDPTVPYRPEFWNSYQVLVPATVEK
ncbi:erythromycin esterase family protein [Hymenobacter sp. UYP22]|uniref:erythromycin esterase family protein n=1 Tax=Hymenobacter sp. UYP22 TaxID=3156348 RepID=UPI003394D04B